MHAEDPSDPQQRRDAGVHRAGLDVLIGLAAHPGGEEHGLLCSVLAQSRYADAVTDGTAFGGEPGVVIGQLGHATNAQQIMIIRQPGIPRFL